MYDGKGVGKRFEIAAAKLYTAVLKYVGTNLSVEGKTQMRMAPMISGVQLRKIIDSETTRYSVEMAKVKTGEVGDGHDHTDLSKSLQFLVNMQEEPSSQKGSVKARASAEYKVRVNEVHEKVRECFVIGEYQMKSHAAHPTILLLSF